MRMSVTHQPWALAVFGALSISVARPSAALSPLAQSAQAMARGEAVVASTHEADAVYYNPAGLTEKDGTSASVSAQLQSDGARFSGAGGEAQTEHGPAIIPNVFVARRISPRAFVGVGIYSPYRHQRSWTPNFAGATASEEYALRTYFVSPVMALRLSEIVSVAVGVSLVPSTIYSRRVLADADGAPLFAERATAAFSGTAFGVGATAGAQIRPTKHLRLGAVFHSAVDLAFSGEVDFRLPGDTPSEIAAIYPDQGADTSVTLPHSFNFGAAWVERRWTAEVGAGFTLWDSTEAQILDFANVEDLPADTWRTDRAWRVQPAFRAGGAYAPIPELTLRAGLSWRPSQVPSRTIAPAFSDGDRWTFAVGLGSGIGFLRVDAAFAVDRIGQRTTADNPLLPAGTFDAPLRPSAQLTLSAAL